MKAVEPFKLETLKYSRRQLRKIKLPQGAGLIADTYINKIIDDNLGEINIKDKIIIKSILNLACYYGNTGIKYVKGKDFMLRCGFHRWRKNKKKYEPEQIKKFLAFITYSNYLFTGIVEIKPYKIEKTTKPEPVLKKDFLIEIIPHTKIKYFTKQSDVLSINNNQAYLKTLAFYLELGKHMNHKKKEKKITKFVYELLEVSGLERFEDTEKPKRAYIKFKQIIKELKAKNIIKDYKFLGEYIEERGYFYKKWVGEQILIIF